MSTYHRIVSKIVSNVIVLASRHFQLGEKAL